MPRKKRPKPVPPDSTTLPVTISHKDTIPATLQPDQVTCIEELPEDLPRSPFDPLQNPITPREVWDIVQDVAECPRDSEGRLMNVDEICKKHGRHMKDIIQKVHSVGWVGKIYRHAQKLRARVYHQDMITEVHDRSGDVLESIDAHGGVRLSANMANVKRSELISKFGQWHLGRLDPDTYAEDKKDKGIHIHGDIKTQNNIKIDDLEHLNIDTISGALEDLR